MNEYRRVVVTGMGIVSPVGSDMKTAWDNLVSGFNGIGPITYFDTTNYKAKLAAQVRDFDPLAYMEKSETLRSDRFAQYAMGAAVQAVEESGVVGTVVSERMAVYFGSGIGGLNTVTTEIGKLESRGPHRVSPLCVPMMIANMAAGMIAIRYLSGPGSACRHRLRLRLQRHRRGSAADPPRLRRRCHHRRRGGLHRTRGHCGLYQHESSVHGGRP